MRKSKKFISFFTAILVILNQLSATPLYAAGATPLEVKTLNPGFQLSLPPDLGTVQTLHSGNGPVLIHIQTAHGNYEAQKKIEAILHYLKDNYGVKTLFL